MSGFLASSKTKNGAPFGLTFRLEWATWRLEGPIAKHGTDPFSRCGLPSRGHKNMNVVNMLKNNGTNASTHSACCLKYEC